MSSAEELIQNIEVAKSQVDEDASTATTGMSGVDTSIAQANAAKQYAEQLASELAGMNISDKSAQANEVGRILGEAAAQCDVVKKQFEEASTNAAAANNKLDEAVMAAQVLMG